ncbi:MAG: ecotin family protein [Cyanobacteriota bacterium]
MGLGAWRQAWRQVGRHVGRQVGRELGRGVVRAGWTAAALVLLSALEAAAIPRLDLSGYPKPAAGDRRWVIRLPGVLPPGRDPSLSPDPRDWRLQLVVGQTALVDCNLHSFSARLRPERLAAGRGTLYRVTNVSPLISTRMACPDQPRQSRFVPMAGKPYVVPYNASVPIVVDAPAPLELRWRLWKAERDSQPA